VRVNLMDNISLRDYFAGQVASGIALNKNKNNLSYVDIAGQAYGIAQAMIEQKMGGGKYTIVCFGLEQVHGIFDTHNEAYKYLNKHYSHTSEYNILKIQGIKTDE